MRNLLFSSVAPTKNPPPTSAPAEPSTAPSNSTRGPSERSAAETATQADKVIVNTSVSVTADDKNPHSLPDRRGRGLTVSLAEFFNALAPSARELADYSGS